MKEETKNKNAMQSGPSSSSVTWSRVGL